jgi:aldose 1-epimerase
MSQGIQQGAAALDKASEDISMTIERLALSRNGVTLELLSLGASISRFLVPSAQETPGNNATDSIVLGYESSDAALSSNNPNYFGAIVGRVANRIAKGRFELEDGKETRMYQLDTNNEPNHLHGGTNGFSSRVWNAEIVDQESEDLLGAHSDLDETHQAVKFSLLSEDGDQGYPGSVLVTAT